MVSNKSADKHIKMAISCRRLISLVSSMCNDLCNPSSYNDSSPVLLVARKVWEQGRDKKKRILILGPCSSSLCLVPHLVFALLVYWPDIVQLYFKKGYLKVNSACEAPYCTHL